MGYYIESRDCNFLLKKENVNAAFDALRNLFLTGFEAGWVHAKNVLSAAFFDDAMRECRFAITSTNGDFDNIRFDGEKYSGDEIKILSAIAPFVEPGSYIEMAGEEGEYWRWIFNSNGVSEQYATLDWGDADSRTHSLTRERAVEIIKEILISAQESELQRGYYECDDYTYYAQALSDNELEALNMPPIQRY